MRVGIRREGEEDGRDTHSPRAWEDRGHISQERVVEVTQTTEDHK